MTTENSTRRLLGELKRVGTLVRRYNEVAGTDPERYDPTLADDDAIATGPESVTDLSYVVPRADLPPLGDPAEESSTRRDDQRQREHDSRLDRLLESFDLQPIHRDVLLLSLLPDVDSAAGGLFENPYGTVATERPTVEFVARLFAETPAEFVTALELFGPDSPLVERDIVVLDPPAEGAAPSTLEYTVRLDGRIRSYLLGQDGVDPALQAHLAEHAPGDVDEHLAVTGAEATLDGLPVDEDLRAELAALPEADGRGRRVYLYGPRGAGHHRAVEALCDADRYLRADLRAVLAGDALDALVREAAVLDVPLQLTDADAATFDDRETERSLEAVLDRLAEFDHDVFVTGRRQWTPSKTRAATVDAICEFERPSIALRREWWRERADDLPAGVEPDTLASTFDLTPGQLEAALATARSLAGGDALTAEDVRAGCRAQSSDDLADLAQHVEPTKTWADIELRERTERQLRTLETHIANRGTIYDDWGFRERDGNAGVVSLFKGLPGTGKTMAAEVLANAVGMDVYKIELSSVVSKYIGETEENLEQIFDAAEQSNAILLFDEADSIFGDRAEVSDATDRYANVEVNYLLQRVETYDGVIVLTTNFAQNIDTAFSRRITHTIHFEKPSEDTRAAIWDGIFPDDAPVEDLDTEWLASFDYSGGDIDKLAKHVAIYAAERDADAVTMRHVVEALEQYKRDQNGRIREKDFEPYLDYLQGMTEREKKERNHRARRT